MLCIDDVYVLITYSTIVESFFIMLSVSAVLYFRYTRPEMVRPIKVWTREKKIKSICHVFSHILCLVTNLGAGDVCSDLCIFTRRSLLCGTV